MFQTKLKTDKMNKEMVKKIYEDQQHHELNLRKNGPQLTQKNALAKGIGFKLVDMDEITVGLLNTICYWMGNDMRSDNCCICFTEVSNADTGLAYTKFKTNSTKLVSIGMSTLNPRFRSSQFRNGSHETKARI
jgi:hypothetical protein